MTRVGKAHAEANIARFHASESLLIYVAPLLRREEFGIAHGGERAKYVEVVRGDDSTDSNGACKRPAARFVYANDKA